ncbi:hypothetical protein [Cupriavidus pinatubonensis]|uniref:Signal peptide transmembrane protein n=1 Tax=Cupriavidus pinatubonensis TaxID=248026 RepID=A0ABN7YMU9_9BURK|nr:hypothetical protein [Cupriavidus pinatubonensis]CAG9173530.1 hypothetical protein LMG23994_02645 [Cupriavidus pinatubonensis]
MPFILLGLALIGALIYGLVRLYHAVADAAGTLAGSGAVALAIALLAALIADGVRRWRAIHGVRRQGERILTVDGMWGSLRIDADRKLGTVVLGDVQSRFIFADIAGAEPVTDADTWALALRLEHNARPLWQIPMPTRTHARRWAKILALAAQQKL